MATNTGGRLPTLGKSFAFGAGVSLLALLGVDWFLAWLTHFVATGVPTLQPRSSPWDVFLHRNRWLAIVGWIACGTWCAKLTASGYRDGRVSFLGMIAAFEGAAARLGLEFVSGDAAKRLASAWTQRWLLEQPPDGRALLYQDFSLFQQRCWVLRDPLDATRLLVVGQGNRERSPVLVRTLTEGALSLCWNVLTAPIQVTGTERSASTDDWIDALIVCLYVRSPSVAVELSDTWRAVIEAAGFQVTPLAGGIRVHEAHDRPSPELVAKRVVADRLETLWRLGPAG